MQSNEFESLPSEVAKRTKGVVYRGMTKATRLGDLVCIGAWLKFFFIP